jgi:hypothetical protein
MTRSSFLPADITILKGMLGTETKSLDNLLEWFQLMRAGLPEKESVGLGAIA